MPLLGYFITYHTYGTWLHGHAEGSVDEDHNAPNSPRLPPDPVRRAIARAALRYPPVELDAEQRYVVNATLPDVCRHRRWALHAKNVRSTHVHVVVTGSHGPERIMNDLKGWGTRRMREAGTLSHQIDPWEYHGSTRYLNTEESLRRAIEYVLHEQGPALEMRCPWGWEGPGSVVGRGNAE
jgi:hypothetical protein